MSQMVKGDCLQLSPFDKSGILIFVFDENNHLVRQYMRPHHVD